MQFLRKSLLPALCSLDRCERDLVAELSEAVDVVPLDTRGVELVEVVGTEIGVGLPGPQQVVGDHEHTVGDGHRRLVLAPATREPVVLRGEVLVPRAGEAPSDLAQDRAQPGVALRRLPAQALA